MCSSVSGFTLYAYTNVLFLEASKDLEKQFNALGSRNSPEINRVMAVYFM